MMIRALIVEDEPLAIDRLRACLALEEDMDIIGEARNGQLAVELINSRSPDLIFLDVQMPLLSGFDVLRATARIPAVIFTTAHNEYAVPAFEWGAFDYLLKPFSQERVMLAVERYRQRSGLRESDIDFAERLKSSENRRTLDRFFIKNGGVAVPINVDDIVAIIADNDYSRVRTENSNHLVHLPLREFERRLNPEHFKRVHRSAIVHVGRIQEIQLTGRGALLHMPGGLTVPASRTGLGQIRPLHL